MLFHKIFHKKQNFFSSSLDSHIQDFYAGDLRALAKIFCVFSENISTQKLKASQVLNEALISSSFDDICKIDIQMRETTSMEWNIDWKTLKIENFITKQMSKDEQRAVLIFSSFNPNGYIREQALKLLVFYEETLPYLVLRLNDWVYNVRQTALTMFSKRLVEATDEELINTLPFLHKLQKSKRGDNFIISSLMQDKFCANEKLLEKGLANSDVRTRKTCLSFISNTSLPKTALLLKHIKKESDPFVRRMIFQILFKENIKIEELSKQFLKDKYPANRLLALQYLYDYNIDLAFIKAYQMLLDRNLQVRILSREIIKTIKKTDNFHQFYLENLSSNTTIAVYGLGEVGCKEDCYIIEPYLKNSKTAVVRAAMISLMHLDSEKYITLITEMLYSEHSSIVNTAFMLLKKYKDYDYKKILEAYQEIDYENAKIKCALLLFQASKWKTLLYILTIIGSNYEKLEAICQAQLSRWLLLYNNSFQSLSKKDSEEIKILINIKKPFLTSKIEKELIFLLKNN